MMGLGVPPCLGRGGGRFDSCFGDVEVILFFLDADEGTVQILASNPRRTGAEERVENG